MFMMLRLRFDSIAKCLDFILTIYLPISFFCEKKSLVRIDSGYEPHDKTNVFDFFFVLRISRQRR